MWGEGSVAATPNGKIAVVTLSEIGKANFGVEVVKMAGVCGQVDTSPLIGQKKERVRVGTETRRPAVVRGPGESRQVADGRGQ